MVWKCLSVGGDGGVIFQISAWYFLWRELEACLEHS